ncbi:unnamed protein product [marine sediment metagenome]|uniref:Uncharacterized protein n=1 Tax=marine sediment metagenome TaxID=412755 RepID=X1I7R6_9ZZZZ
MLDGNRPSAEVNIAHRKAQGFADATTEVKQQPDKKPISQVLG